MKFRHMLLALAVAFAMSAVAACGDKTDDTGATADEATE